MTRGSGHCEWPTIPLRYVCELNPPVSFDGLRDDDDVTFLPMERVKAGFYIPNIGKVSDNASSYNSFAEGDILLAKVTPCFENGNIAIAENLIGGKGFGSSELFVLRPARVNGRFLFYALQSPLFKQVGEASMTGAGGLKRVSPDLLREYQLCLPSEVTQRAIANYLDRETERLDALIAAKERLLALLAEKRQALITRAVTRGLDPNVPLRDSGIPWLGPIPAHWETKRAKWLFSERDERALDGQGTLLSLRMDVGLVPHNDVSEKVMRPDEVIGYKRTYPKEIVVNRMRAAIGLIAVTPQMGLVSPDYAVFSCQPPADPEYFTHLFKTPLMQSAFRSESKGLGTGSSGFLRLYSEDFLAFWIPAPPLAEQMSIVENLQRECEKLSALRGSAERTIALLKERRSALIAAAVSGQIPIPPDSLP